MKFLCLFLGHTPDIMMVKHEWGYPADQECYCTRCGREGTWHFTGDGYMLAWSVK